MTRRHIHYEAAFEDLLRSTGTPYIAVDEAKRAIFAGAKIGSFDFLINGTNGLRFFVDVKGRKFPYETRSGRRYWENWIPRQDIDDMVAWERVFGEDCTGLLVFAYWLTELNGQCPFDDADVHPFRGEHYVFLGVTLADYRAHCRLRSRKWDTVSIGAPTFRKLVIPLRRLLVAD